MGYLASGYRANGDQMPRHRPAPEMLTELEQELDRNKVYEARLRKSGKKHLHGLYEQTGGVVTVWINPRPMIVETLLHELIHCRWPNWSETRVDREARRLLQTLDDGGVDKWFRAYQRAKRNTKRTNGLKED